MQLGCELAVFALQLADLTVGGERFELGVDIVQLVVESVELPCSVLVFIAELGEQLPVAEPASPAGGVLEPSGDTVQLVRVSGAAAGQFGPSAGEVALPGDVGGVQAGVQLPPPGCDLDQVGGDRLFGVGASEPAG